MTLPWIKKENFNFLSHEIRREMGKPHHCLGNSFEIEAAEDFIFNYKSKWSFSCRCKTCGEVKAFTLLEVRNIDTDFSLILRQKLISAFARAFRHRPREDHQIASIRARWEASRIRANLPKPQSTNTRSRL